MRFYQRTASDPALRKPRLPDGFEARIWQPGLEGFPWRQLDRPSNIAWWTMERCGLFSRGGFFEVRIIRDNRLMHRLIATPRWYRFPFMGAKDFQIGDLWTRPEARGQGLARAAIGEALRRLNPAVPRIWYVTAHDNEASIRLIESCDFRLVATGSRTRRLGISMLGQFVTDPVCD